MPFTQSVYKPLLDSQRRDGVEVQRQKTPEEAKVPLYMLVNLAMGGGWPIDQAVSPSYMYVDYVRAYARRP